MNKKINTKVNNVSKRQPLRKTILSAALCGEEDTHTLKHSSIQAFEHDDIFSDLQSLWDEQSRRIDQLLDEHPASQPRALNFRRYRPWRRRVMAECLALALLNIAVGLYALASFLPNTYILIRVTGYVLACTNALMTFRSLYIFLSLLRHNPARVGTSRMSRFISRTHTEPHYAPSGHRMSRKQVVNDSAPSTQTFNSPFSIFNFPQVAAVSAAAMVVLVFVSCAPVGDGHVMSKLGRADRAATIVNIDEIVAKI